MKYPPLKNRPSKFRYDFELGYLVKSPCKESPTRPHFPKCINACKILDMLHEKMANTISCSRKN
ncbi:MAG: hypothetical protein WBG37_16280 [Desulfobacterales bacterium]